MMITIVRPRRCNRVIALLSITILILGLVIACGKKETGLSQEIVYRLKWLYNAGTVGELYATKYGIFEKEGLSVTVKAGGPEYNVINELELGNCQFGVASADQVITALAKGADLVVLAQIFQENPLQWIFRKNAIILNTPSDLKGKRVAITYGGNDEAIFKALLASYQLIPDELFVSSARRDYTPFFEGRVDLWPTYRNVEGVAIAGKMKSAGEETDFFDPGVHGIHFVANSVITTAKFYTARQQLCERVVQAAMKGWTEALDTESVAKAVQAVKDFDPQTDPAIIARQIAATRKLVIPEPGFPVGKISVAAWQETEAIMLQQGLIKQPVHIERRLKQHFIPVRDFKGR